MTFTDYAAIKAMNWSTLKHGVKSMKHLHHAMTTADSGDTPARVQLRAAHFTVLEPDAYDRDVVIYPGAVRRGREWEAFKAEYTGKTILNQTEYMLRQVEHERMMRIRDAVMSNRDAAFLLADVETEYTAQWSDPSTGLPCKGRLDVFAPGRHIADLKGDSSVEDRVIGRRVGQLLYYGQAAWYQTGIEQLTGRRLPYYVIAYETKAPHDVAVFEVDEDWLGPGRDLCERLMGDYAMCLRTGVWPGRYAEIQHLPSPPQYINPDVGDDFEIVE